MSSVCHTCGVREDDFSRRSYFDNHVKLHDNTNVLAFNEHVRSYHFRELPCSQCDQKFTANVALKRHMRIHNKSSDNFPCDVCSKTFSRLACEKFTKIFPLRFARSLTRKMHVLSLVLSKYIREKGIYYEFLCLEQAGERAHNRRNIAEKIFATITNEEQRYFKMMKNQDKCDKTIFTSKKILFTNKK